VNTFNAASARRTAPAFLALSCIGCFATAAGADPLAGAGTDPVEPTGAPDPVGDGQSTRRDDVVVVGLRGEQERDPKQVARPLDTPRSLVILSKDVIEQTGSTTLQDALRTVPGITFGAAEGGNPIGDRPFLRGFDSQGSIYVDGVRDLGSQSREVFAIDNVQIVRGSDSTLGGRGSPGGTINIISRLPQLNDAATVNASFGNADFKRITADVNGRLAPTVAVRVEGMWDDQGVAGRNAIYQRRWGVAPSITVGLGTDTRLTAAYYLLQSHELPDSGIPYLYVCSTTVCNAPTGNVFTTPAIGRVTTYGGQTGYVDRSTFYGLTDRDFRTTSTNQATLRIEHDFGKLTLRNTARYDRDDQAYSFLLPDDSNGDVFGFPLPGAAINPADGGTKLTGGGYVWRRANTRYAFTQSLTDQADLYGTFATGAIQHSIAVGAEVSWEKDRRGAYVLATGSTISPRCDTFTVSRYYCTSLFNPNPNDPWTNYASDTSTAQAPIVRGGLATETQNDAETQGVYGFDSITLLPQLIVNLGARYDRFKSTITPPGTPQVRLSRTDRLFNWQAGVVVKPTADTSLYADYATAATPPNSLLGEGREDNALPTTTTTAAGLAAAAVTLNQLKPQKTKSYEVGAKAALFHERLSLSADVFQTEIDNARVQVDAATVAFIGRSRIRGVEASVSGTILPGWTVFGGYTFLDAVIQDGGNSTLTAAAVVVNGRTVQAAQTVYVPSVNTGKPLPNTVRNSFTATTSYQVTPRLRIGGTAIHNDRQYGGYADNRLATQTAAGVVSVSPATTILYRGVPGYWRFDLNAGLQVDRHVTISVNAQNVTDKVYFNQAYASHYASIAPGRTVFGTLGVRF
jgi:catecholate siderophore receptor